MQLIQLDNSPNHSFPVLLSVNGSTIKLFLYLSYNEVAGYWVMRISDPTSETTLIDSIPLVTDETENANLLAQYDYMKIGNAYLVKVAPSDMDYPNDTNLGTAFHLLWGDNTEGYTAASAEEAVAIIEALTDANRAYGVIQLKGIQGPPGLVGPQGPTGPVGPMVSMDEVVAATAESDFIVAGPTPFAWIKKTLLEVKALIGLVPQTIGFTIAGGTTSRTLTVDADKTISNLMNKTGSNLAVGSDADGDMYYRASGVLARLAKGTGSQTLKMNSGATAPEWVTVVVTSDIPSGTKMLFYANTAPTGWTIDNTLDDKVVYVTKGSGAGGQTGGGVHSAGTWTQPNHTHTGPSHTHTGPSHTHTGPSHTHTTAAMTLDTTRIPSHQHYLPRNYGGSGSGGAMPDGKVDDNAPLSQATGGGGSHEHGATGAEGTGATGAGGTGATGAEGTGATGGSATANTWRPAAYCMIICTKN